MSAGMSGFSDYPMALGEVYGMRTWDALYNGTLEARHSHFKWVPGQNDADCARLRALDSSYLGRARGWHSFIDEHTAKDLERARRRHLVSSECGCGFWAYHGSPGIDHYSGVVGVVRGWGKTVVGTKGFRCEHAEIVALAFPRRTWFGRALSTWLPTVVIFFLGWLAAARMLNGVTTGPFWSWWSVLDIGLWLLSFVAQTFIYGAIRFAGERWNTAWWQVDPDLQGRIRAQYPDVPIYTSVRAMRRAFPFEDRRQLVRDAAAEEAP